MAYEDLVSMISLTVSWNVTQGIECPICGIQRVGTCMPTDILEWWKARGG